MVRDEAKVAVQSYSFIKDIWLYLKNKQRYAHKLEDNLTHLTVELRKIDSRTTEAERKLHRDVSTEKSKEYLILEEQIEVFNQKCKKYVNKYIKDRGDLPAIAEASIESEVTGSNQKATMDISIARRVMEHLQERKPTIFTHKFFRLAKLSTEIKRLHDCVSSVLDRIKTEDLFLEKGPEYVQVKKVDIDIPSFSEYVNEVLTYLNKYDIRSIGIWGQIGVGKTTVLKMLNNQLKDTKHGIAIWLDYPNTQDNIVEAMQDVIIKRLKLIQREGNTKADIISRALHQRKYILLIDQVISGIDLDKVGIRKSHEFGKVVVASCNMKLIKQMTDHFIEMRALSKKDAFILFEKVRGEIQDTRIKYIAEKIIESCEGLPLVIMTVARYLKGEQDEDTWKGVKRAIESEPELIGLGRVGNAYKLVYDGLEKSYMKKCLLFVALFPSGHEIDKDYLVECWNAEGFLHFPELSRAREHGALVLGVLTDRYLLENCSDKYVKMPVYVRKVALKQEYPGEKNCINWVPEKDRLLNAETWRTARRMSLICFDPKLSGSPESHNISTLLLQRNPNLVTFGDMFFLNMPNLRILDLSQTGIESLPSSIDSLLSLICLYLKNCYLIAELPRKVKMLKKLEVLDIRGTSIRRLPNEMGDLFHLRCLRISFAHSTCNRKSKGKGVEMMIPLNIISRLQQLEELTIEAGCCSQGWNAIADQIAVELAHLEKLSTLIFHFPSVSSLKKFVTSSKSWKDTHTHGGRNTFRSFKFSIGCNETSHPYGLDISRILPEQQLRFSTNEEISSVREVLRQASSFELVGHSGVESLSEFDLPNTGALKVCVVERCNNLLRVVDASKIDEMQVDSMGDMACAILPLLEKLHLFDLQLQQSIWDGPVFPGSLSNLKVLTLFGCPELTEILDHELAKALSSLKHLKVANCSKIVEIVKTEISDEQNISEDVDILHKVKTIELVDLPKLQSICRNTSINWKSLKKIVIIGCEKLRNLDLTFSNAGKLETINCEVSWETLYLLEEQKKHFLAHCDFVDMEEALAIRAHHQGESSNNKRLVDPQESDVIVSQQHSSEDRLEEVMPSRGSSNDLLMSNINLDDHYEKPKVENPPIHEGLLIPSDIVAETDSGIEKPKVRSMKDVEMELASAGTTVPIAGLIERDEPVRNVPIPELRSEHMPTSEIMSGGETAEGASSQIYDDLIPEISPEDSNPPYASEIQIENRCESDITEEGEAQEDMVANVSSLLIQNTGLLRRHETMPSQIDNPRSIHQNESGLGMAVTLSVSGKMSNFVDLKLEILGTSSAIENLNSNNYFGLDPKRDNYLFFAMKKPLKLELYNQGTFKAGQQPSEPSESFQDDDALLPMILNKSGRSSEGMPTADEWRQAGVVNLMEKSSLLLDKKPDCPDLVLLFLQRNNCLTHIAPSFFDCMPALRFLDLSNTRIRALPSSLFKLRELQVLMLRSCICLDSLPAKVKELEDLEVLDLLGTDLYYLPKQVGLPTQLKHLQLSFYGPDYGSGYARFPSKLVSPSIFSKLPALQALSIVVHPEDQRWIRDAGEIIQHVGSLTTLSYLQFYFPTVEALECFINISPSWKEERLKRFKFVVGHNIKRIISRVPDEVESKYEQQDRCLRFVNGNEVPEVVKEVLKPVTAFYLDNHLEIKNLSEFGISNFKEVKFCVVRECPNFQVMMKCKSSSDSESAFPNLEHLRMHYLWELERIWEDPVPPGSFEALKYLVVDTCPKLEFIASRAMLRCLSNLETFIVQDCEALKSIVQESEMVKYDGTLLPRLTKLELRHLPQLVTLGSDLCPPEKIINVHYCPKLILSSQRKRFKRTKFQNKCSICI